MSWASARETTRVEDQAYCLLGIFGINMPLVYGEGPGAFLRLQGELIKTLDDETVFAHDGSALLAQSPDDYADGYHLQILHKDAPMPYSLTNAGLDITMRVVDRRQINLRYEDSDLEASFFGILNCHYNVAGKRHLHVALPLQEASRKNSFTKANGRIHQVEMRSGASEARPIFIQTRAVQLSRITLAEQCDLLSSGINHHSLTTPYIYNTIARECRLYPDALARYEAVAYTISIKGLGNDHIYKPHERRAFVVFFELSNNTAGVIEIPRSPSYSVSFEFSGEVIKRLFSTWTASGRPSSLNFILGSRDLQSDVHVHLRQKTGMRQFVWLLHISEPGIRDCCPGPWKKSQRNR